MLLSMIPVLLAAVPAVAASAFRPIQARGDTSDDISVKVHFHVIALSESDESNVPDSKLKEQFHVLNERYNDYGVKFDLSSIDRHVNASWAVANINSQLFDEMRNASHIGDYTELNIWTVANLTYYDQPVNGGPPQESQGNPSGVGIFPIVGLDFDPDTGKDLWRDGIIMDYRYLPGSQYREGRDLGVTMVTLVGHWFGLEKTWIRGCDGLGDSVKDTPSSLFSTGNICNSTTVLDTCPDKPGVDPVDNYMNSAWDSCQNKFTTGQVERLRQLWYLLRWSRRSF